MVRAFQPHLGSVGFGEKQDQVKNPTDLRPHHPPLASPSLFSTTSIPNRHPRSPASSTTRPNRSPRQRAFPPDTTSLRTPPAYPAEHIVAEIVVRTDETMEDDVMEGDSPAPSRPARQASTAAPSPMLAGPATRGPAGAPSTSFSASTPALSEHSELHSSSASLSSKATTPALGETAKDVGATAGAGDASTRTPSHVLLGASVPPAKRVSMKDFSRQCTQAAAACRLDPYALHADEKSLLEDHITIPQVTNYLLMRNRILRLWIANPQNAVTREEAEGCATQAGWQALAGLCYDFLMRRGHINFGCCAIAPQQPPLGLGAGAKQAVVVVIGAGVSGLSCARHLVGLIAQNEHTFSQRGERPPKVMNLEARDRVGGRVYSREFASLDEPPNPSRSSERHTAEVGGMIITGFEHGNPLNVVVRGQLELRYYKLRPNLKLFDQDGKIPDKLDTECENLFNYCLERLSPLKYPVTKPSVFKGDKERIQSGEDVPASAAGTIRACEDAVAALSLSAAPAVNEDMPDAKLRPQMIASVNAELLGFPLRDGVSHPNDFGIAKIIREPGATLGSAGDALVEKFQSMLDLDPRRMRIVNWHIANHEYSIANNWSSQSLRGWDIDAGNEWRGEHSIIVGGYEAVPRGLACKPTPLDVRQNSPVTKILYDPHNPHGKAAVELASGETIEADYVVCTLPLGVLKHGSVVFEPPLPESKSGPIERLAFGPFNKVVLAYKERFWDTDWDFFGFANGPADSVTQKDYSADRGYLFQWMDISESAETPCLVAFVAGDAAYRAEELTEEQVIADATDTLRLMFPSKVPPNPVQAFVTRWSSDPFARGTYSSAGPDMRADDYEAMAKPVGNLFFAGEHTSSTHPATVHGAFLTGLRSACELFEHMVGPLAFPAPLIAASTAQPATEKRSDSSAAGLERAAASNTPTRAPAAALPIATAEHRARMESLVNDELGVCPQMVKTPEWNERPFELFHRERVRSVEVSTPERVAIPYNVLRGVITKLWKEASRDERKKFEQQALQNKAENQRIKETCRAEIKEWKRKAIVITQAYANEHSIVLSSEDTLSYQDDAPAPRSPPRTRKRGRAEENHAELSGTPPTKK